MQKLPRETIDGVLLDPNHVYHEHTADANEYERNHTIVYDIEPNANDDVNIFGGIIPSSPEERMDLLQEYSNRTGFTGQIGGFNVKPRKYTQRQEQIRAVALFAFLFFTTCLVMGFLGSILQP